MKKIIILFLCIFCLETVSAVELKDVTNDTQIKYKWYQETITEGFYHPKKEKTPEYLEDKNNIKYGDYSEWGSEYCSYSKENYLIEEKNINTYEKVAKTKYLSIEFIKVDGEYCIDCLGEIKIFSERETIDYKILIQNDKVIRIELPKEYDTEKLWFYIEADRIYNMYLFKDINLQNMNLAQYVKRTKILIPNKNWITGKTTFVKETTEEEIPNNDFIRNIETTKVCRVREINTYRYKTQKKYYDNNYYTYLENHIPDINNYIVYYTNEFPTDTIEITKTISEPIYLNKYTYIESDNETNKLDEENKITEQETIKEQSTIAEKIVYRTEYVDKVVNKIPKKIYLLLSLLLIIVVILSIKLMKKKVD